MSRTEKNTNRFGLFCTFDRCLNRFSTYHILLYCIVYIYTYIRLFKIRYAILFKGDFCANVYGVILLARNFSSWNQFKKGRRIISQVVSTRKFQSVITYNSKYFVLGLVIELAVSHLKLYPKPLQVLWEIGCISEIRQETGEYNDSFSRKNSTSINKLLHLSEKQQFADKNIYLSTSFM